MFQKSAQEANADAINNCVNLNRNSQTIAKNTPQTNKGGVSCRPAGSRIVARQRSTKQGAILFQLLRVVQYYYNQYQSNQSIPYYYAAIAYYYYYLGGAYGDYYGYNSDSYGAKSGNFKGSTTYGCGYQNYYCCYGDYYAHYPSEPSGVTLPSSPLTQPL